MAADNGQLQLNAFEPVIAHVLFQGLDHFTRVLDTLRLRCVDGITCDATRVAKLREDVWSSASLATALSPWIGYQQATTVARESQRSGRTVVDIVRTAGTMTGAELDTALSTTRLTTGT